MTEPRTEISLEDLAWLTALARSLVRDGSSADDLVQQTWVAAAKSPPRGGRTSRAWLGRVLRNFNRKRIRSDQRRATREQAASKSGFSPSAAEVLERRELRRSMVDCLRALREPYRTTLILSAFEGYSPAQISEREGVSKAAVRDRLRIAREEFQRRFARVSDISLEQWQAMLLALPLPLEAPARRAAANASRRRGRALAPRRALSLQATLVLAASTLAIFGTAAVAEWPAARPLADAAQPVTSLQPRSAASFHDRRVGTLPLNQTSESSPRSPQMNPVEKSLFPLLLATTAASQQEWREVTVASPPAVRWQHALSWDGSNVLMLGGTVNIGAGTQTTPYATTHRWNGSAWQSLGVKSPPPRRAHKMVYDSARNRVVLFGGVTGSNPNQTRLNDTWEWDGSMWHDVSPNHSPLPRQDHGMAYDANRGTVVIFGGGGDDPGNLDDTWEWDGVAWTLRAQGRGPLPRNTFAMAFDAGCRQTLLFGGHGTDTTNTYPGFFSDTWAWDGVSWTKVADSIPGGARRAASMAFDSFTGQMVLFGGSRIESGTWVSLGDTYVWGASGWQEVTAAGAGMRTHHAMAYDSSRRSIVLMGGTESVVTGVPLNDTWEFSTYGKSTTVGQGCEGTWGAPAIGLCPGSAPALGQTLCIDLTNGPPAAPGPLLSLSGSLLPAPLSLDEAGAPTCELHVIATDIVSMQPTTNGWQWSTQVPSDLSLIGTTLGMQAIVPDAVNSLGLTFSNGLEVCLGVR